MDNIKKNYTTVNNWVQTMKNLCEFNIRVKIAVYNTPSVEKDKCCFEVATSLKNIITNFGEYFIYYVKTDNYGTTNASCLNLLICKNRPNEEHWTEYKKEN